MIRRATAVPVTTDGKASDRGAVIDMWLIHLQRWCFRFVVISAAAAIAGWLVGRLWMVVFPVVMAVLIATILVPPVAMLRRKGWPRGLAVASVILGSIALVGMVIAILAPRIAGQADDLAAGASEGLQQIRDWLIRGPLGASAGQISNVVAAIQERIQASGAAISSGVFTTIGAATSAVVSLFLVLMLAFFFTKDGHSFIPWASKIGGRRAGHHVAEVLRRTWDTLGGFVRTQSLVALIDAVLIGVGLLIMGVPLAISLAVVTFVTAFIPIVGALASGALAVLVTLVTNGATDALIVLGIVVAVQQIEGNVLLPWLQGNSLDLHASIVLLSVTAGGTLFGVAGAFFAVPFTAVTAALLGYVSERVDAATYAERSEDAFEATTDSDSDEVEARA